MLSRTTGMRAARKVVTGKTWQIVVLVNPVQVAATATTAQIALFNQVSRFQKNYRTWVRGESSGIDSYMRIGDPSKDAISRITCKV